MIVSVESDGVVSSGIGSFEQEHNKNTNIKEISTAIDGIRKDSIHIASDYRNFIAVYEAIVAYHKFYGGKDN